MQTYRFPVREFFSYIRAIYCWQINPIRTGVFGERVIWGGGGVFLPGLLLCS